MVTIENIDCGTFTAHGEFELYTTMHDYVDIRATSPVVISSGSMTCSTNDDYVKTLVAGCLTYEQRSAILQDILF